MKEKLAQIITFIFDPTVVVPLFLAILVSETGLTTDQLKTILPSLFLVDFILPGSLLILFLREGWISDWEISKRKERFNLYFGVALLWFLGSTLTLVFGNGLLFKFHLIFTLVFFLATLITLFWKISMHMVVDTAVIVLLNLLLGNLWYFYLILPLVAWSRYIRHKHTPLQLLGGFLLSVLIIFLGFNAGLIYGNQN